MRKVVAVGDSFALEKQLSMVDQAHQVGKSSVMLAVELKRFQATIPDRPFVNMLFSTTAGGPQFARSRSVSIP